ncbi:GntR family transcriptional regulator [Corynebacterium caspium]|uniref:GntR family transcriptional regulator n=1 Tax=Corynebacterium caspium TaxID=234828 RepID=UPI000379CDF6|nr:GntR family transcriptional regulator [Corynebacterium caspium]WKD58482.1 putative HTH-type transcriptional regulator YurK [Corynebacterium caspium DSM 44850]
MSKEKAKYAAVRDDLRKRMRAMSTGDKIPSESQLCQEYQVSRITVRRAIDDLTQEGLLERVQGRGTYVVEPRYTERIQESFSDQVSGFYRQQAALGREVTTQVISNTVTRNPQAATALDLHPTAELICLERLRFVDNTLRQYVITYLPASRFPAVLSHDFSRGSLFEFLETHYQVSLTSNNLLVHLATVDEYLAPLLEVPENTAVLAIDSTVYSDQNTPIAFGIATHTPAYSQVSFAIHSGD